jgi:plasmid maintenance system killer protein
MARSGVCLQRLVKGAAVWRPTGAYRFELKDHCAITVNGNWRMIFMFDGADAILVDYLDYH